MSKKYTEEFLISELQRFVKENGRNPKVIDMQDKFGYPSFMSYVNYFGSWNKALIEAGLKIYSGYLDGTETCDNCGELKQRQWYYINNQRLCNKCYQKTLKNYINGNLDPESNVGFGFIGQRVVAKTLGLELKYDCNCSQGFGSEYDLYDKKLGSINVKTSVLNNKNYWQFDLSNKYTPDTYVMLGFANDKSDILHVWITEPEDDLTFEKTKISITAAYLSGKRSGLNRAEPWEVDCAPYNDAYHNMSLENCNILRSD